MKTSIKTAFIITFLAVLSTQLFAQDYLTKQRKTSSTASALKNIGFRAGANWSTMTQFPLIENYLPDFQFMPAPSGAVFTEIPLSEQFSIQPEIAFTQKGFLVKEYTTVGGDFLGVNIPLGGRLAFKTNYIEIPVLAKINLGDAEQTHAYLLAGPSVGYLFDSRAVINVLGIFPIRTDIGTGFFNKVDFSGIAGAGVSIPMGASKFFVEGRYQLGLSRVLETGFLLMPVRNRTFGVSLGVQIPLGRS